MPAETYHGYTIEATLHHQSYQRSGATEATGGSSGAAKGVCEIEIGTPDEPSYQLAMVVYRPSYPDSALSNAWVHGEDAEAMAVGLGRRWTHGLIHLGRVHAGGRDIQFRLDRPDPFDGSAPSDWEPFAPQEEQLSDDEVRLELLRALWRMHRAQANSSVFLDLDTAGIADVLRVPIFRVREVLGDLIAEGLTEPFLETMGGHDAQSGRCRITGDGLRTLREMESQRTTAPAPASQSQVIHVHGGSVNVAQTGTGNVAQTIASSPRIKEVEELLAELRAAIQQLKAPEDERADLLEPVTRLEAGIHLPKPPISRLQTAWGAIRVLRPQVLC